MGHALGNNYGKSYSFLSKPVLLDLQFEVDATQPYGTKNIKGQGVKNVIMQSSSPASDNPMVNSTSAGYCLIELEYNYARLYSSMLQIRSPLAGSNLAINASALTAGLPYTITSVGHGPAGVCTIAPVADSSGSLASTYFFLYDAYGNKFVIWFCVSGVGSPPSGVSGTMVQQSILANATAAQIGAALVLTINNLPSGLAGTFSFTSAGTTTVTATSTNFLPLQGPPADGATGTGFTFALTRYGTNTDKWQAVGLPKGIVPVVGASFIATAAGYSTGGASTGLVKAEGVSAVFSFEVFQDPNQSIGPIPMGGSPNSGSLIIGQFLSPTIDTGAYKSPMVPAAPASGTIVCMALLLEQGARVGGNSE